MSRNKRSLLMTNGELDYESKIHDTDYKHIIISGGISMERKHRGKMIAPIIITAIIVLYYIGFFTVCVWLPMPVIMKLLFGLVPLVFAGVCIFVLIERIQEIRSGEEDDISKY